ncbi:MAG: transfer agent family protein [Hyphomicrobiales bacterium]|jgi:hypothetical protein|nr:transfer agent family protein [Hyphomicrobiales bacterium]
MANARRGDIEAQFGATRYTLRLTLGALAELESAFGATDLVGLAARFESGRLSARDLLRIIGAGLRGAGHPLTDDDVAKLPVEGGLPAYARIASDLLAVTFGDALADGGPSPVPTPPQGA